MIHDANDTHLDGHTFATTDTTVVLTWTETSYGEKTYTKLLNGASIGTETITLTDPNTPYTRLGLTLETHPDSSFNGGTWAGSHNYAEVTTANEATVPTVPTGIFSLCSDELLLGEFTDPYYEAPVLNWWEDGYGALPVITGTGALNGQSFSFYAEDSTHIQFILSGTESNPSTIQFTKADGSWVDGTSGDWPSQRTGGSMKYTSDDGTSAIWTYCNSTGGDSQSGDSVKRLSSGGWEDGPGSRPNGNNSINEHNNVLFISHPNTPVEAVWGFDDPYDVSQ
ncbi:unnamed protein product [Bathycoccus prasinos]